MLVQGRTKQTVGWRPTGNLAAAIPAGAVDLLVFGLVGGLHVPIEAILETQ